MPYYKEKLADEIVRHIKDIIVGSTHLSDDNLSYIFLSTDYTTTFDSFSREYVFNVDRLKNFIKKNNNQDKKPIC